MMTGRDSLIPARDLLADASPRPWYFDGWDVFSTGATDDTSGHRLVFPLPHPTWHPSQRVSPADAELAVRAVNEYEVLLDTEDDLRAYISQTQGALRHIIAYCNGATIGSRDHLTAVADLRSIETIAREALCGE